MKAEKCRLSRGNLLPGMLTFMIFFLTACEADLKENRASSADKAAMDYNALAEEICSCAEPAIRMNKKLFQLRRERYQSNWNELIAEAESLGRKALDCCRKVKSTYPSEASFEEPELRQVLIRQCPEMPEMLFSEILQSLTEE
jgi:hypothetical protein